jgi:hypothetical protein
MNKYIFLALTTLSSHAFAGGISGGTPGLTKPSNLLRLNISPMEYREAAMSAIENKSILLNQKLVIPTAIDPLKREILVRDPYSDEVISLQGMEEERRN